MSDPFWPANNVWVKVWTCVCVVGFAMFLMSSIKFVRKVSCGVAECCRKTLDGISRGIVTALGGQMMDQTIRSAPSDGTTSDLQRGQHPEQVLTTPLIDPSTMDGRLCHHQWPLIGSSPMVGHTQRLVHGMGSVSSTPLARFQNPPGGASLPDRPMGYAPPGLFYNQLPPEVVHPQGEYGHYLMPAMEHYPGSSVGGLSLQPRPTQTSSAYAARAAGAGGGPFGFTRGTYPTRPTPPKQAVPAGHPTGNLRPQAGSYYGLDGPTQTEADLLGVEGDGRPQEPFDDLGWRHHPHDLESPERYEYFDSAYRHSRALSQGFPASPPIDEEARRRDIYLEKLRLKQAEGRVNKLLVDGERGTPLSKRPFPLSSSRLHSNAADKSSPPSTRANRQATTPTQPGDASAISGLSRQVLTPCGVSSTHRGALGTLGGNPLLPSGSNRGLTLPDRGGSSINATRRSDLDVRTNDESLPTVPYQDRKKREGIILPPMIVGGQGDRPHGGGTTISGPPEGRTKLGSDRLNTAVSIKSQPVPPTVPGDPLPYVSLSEVHLGGRGGNNILTRAGGDARVLGEVEDNLWTTTNSHRA